MTPQGWECPRCGTIWAPHVPKCECVPTKRVITYEPENPPVILRYEWPRPDEWRVTCESSAAEQWRRQAAFARY